MFEQRTASSKRARIGLQHLEPLLQSSHTLPRRCRDAASYDIMRPPPLPGFGLPLSYDPKDRQGRLFPSVLDPYLSDFDAHSRARLQAFTLRELRMFAFMNAVTDKPSWETKVFDESILEKWKEEMGVKEGAGVGDDGDQENNDGVGSKAEEADAGSNVNSESHQSDDHGDDDNSIPCPPDFTQRMFQYCIEELRYRADVYKKHGFIQVLSGEIFKSDTVIPSELQESLKAAVAPLENVPENERDWHPGSNEQVLDLVHPSLFPLVYGLSRILPNTTTNLDDCIGRCGAGETVVLDTLSKEDLSAYSEKFQWLPCDVDISGESPKILTYINNLHPQKHEHLYAIIEKILARIIPLWNATLSPLLSNDVPHRIKYEGAAYDDAAWEKYLEDYGPKKSEDADEDEDEIFWERSYELERKYKSKFYLHPDVEKDFVPPEDDIYRGVDLKRDFSSTGLQVIVKLANIHLTPANPEYAGGTWHIEGQLNEHICATAIYYYDVDNISSSYLNFRSSVDSDHLENGVGYEQHDNDWLDVIYGLENWQPLIQELGGIQAREGRLVTFPNILQHQVQPFRLVDPTKPGHRKILAFFLVDPNIKIISTANVPCQRQDWREELVLESSVLAKLPAELRDIVVKSRDEFPISLNEAKVVREELMEERKEYVLGYQDQNFKNTSVSLCEH
ncbi:hypothetical protein NP233_g9227 [Leucocoprinus birnbaumii]|uniref:Uncharacterized protein n=1 Tax=Leucocoprinus birnbaumii TaxID=56174 RepID=A0AAD5VL09_9AGAR|nr:hypothetical protein NP233_g9227 [Leucocoprinus birnbaumii]